MTILPLWTFFPNCLGTCSIFTMLMKLLYVCCVPFRQPAHVHSLDVSHCVLLQGKAQQIHSQDISSDGFSSGRCWQDLLQNRGWWRRLDCKATVFSMCMLTYLYTWSNDAPLCFRVATTCTVLLLR